MGSFVETSIDPLFSHFLSVIGKTEGILGTS